MLASVPPIRTVPEAIAEANGERRSENSRAYGSSDVSLTCSVTSPGIVADERDLARARDLETRRPGLEREVHVVAAHGDLALHVADALVLDEQVAEARVDVVGRVDELAAAARRELERARQRHLREGEHVNRLDGDAAPVRLERVGALPLDVRGAADRAGALADVHAVEPDAGADEAQRRRRARDPLVVRDGRRDGHAAEPVRPGVGAVEMELARADRRRSGTRPCRRRAADRQAATRSPRCGR